MFFGFSTVSQSVKGAESPRERKLSSTKGKNVIIVMEPELSLEFAYVACVCESFFGVPVACALSLFRMLIYALWISF